MITILDYGVGNLTAIANVYRTLGVEFQLARTVDELSDADRLILPGVGAFDTAMVLLEKSGMLGRLHQLAIEEKVPILGICVGMQMLAERSEEGSRAGLGWIHGNVRKFPPENRGRRTILPHMGWNDVRPLSHSPLLTGLEENARFYFLHSYYFDCSSKENILAVSDYDIEFCSIVREGNIYGAQFHPEKSHQCGVQLLKNFSEVPKC
jgi:glutamine amidotransferase